MEIIPTPAPASGGIARAAGKAPPDGGSANEMAGDFETFLKLLTAQLRNQDPLQPMDSTEFVAQLASFSAVEQQVRANDRLACCVGFEQRNRCILIPFGRQNNGSCCTQAVE